MRQPRSAPVMRCCMPCLHGICRVRCSPWSESELQQDGEIWLQNHDSTGSCGGNGRYILSGFLIGSAYRLFRELMPGRGIFLFLLSGSAGICGNTPPAEDPKGDAPGTRQAGYGTACAEWEMEKVKGLYDTGNTLRDATTKKPVSVVPYTVILELFPDEMRTGIAALARHETVPEPERLLALQPRYIPFRGLEGRGFLPVIRISEMILVTEHTARHISGPLIALGGENSSSPRGYEIILHPDLMEGQEE